MAFQDRTVRDEVWLNALGDHALQQSRNLAHFVRPCTGIHERVEGHDRKVKFQLKHLLIDSPNAFDLLLLSEALQDGTIHHCIDLIAVHFIFGTLADELVASLRIAIGDESFHHAAKSYTVRCDVTYLHFAPRLPNTLDILQGTIRTDQVAVGLRILQLDVFDGVLPEVPLQEVRPITAEASLNNSSQQTFIHSLVQVVHKNHDPFQIINCEISRSGFQEYAAHDAVRLDTTLLDILDQSPNLLGAVLDCCVQ
mmetsp:Transcript_55250/g.103787  ORF Transcript_55250/g.103787 Transcript_55250/m.103787 type:complete len:253 (+) Transcript_55250:698-1456(+)